MYFSISVFLNYRHWYLITAWHTAMTPLLRAPQNGQLRYSALPWPGVLCYGVAGYSADREIPPVSIVHQQLGDQDFLHPPSQWGCRIFHTSPAACCGWLLLLQLPSHNSRDAWWVRDGKGGILLSECQKHFQSLFGILIDGNWIPVVAETYSAGGMVSSDLDVAGRRHLRLSSGEDPVWNLASVLLEGCSGDSPDHSCPVGAGSWPKCPRQMTCPQPPRPCKWSGTGDRPLQALLLNNSVCNCRTTFPWMVVSLRGSACRQYCLCSLACSTAD